MDANEIRAALNNLETIALAYTVKTSVADTPEQFLQDYTENVAAFKNIKAQNSAEWMS